MQVAYDYSSDALLEKLRGMMSDFGVEMEDFLSTEWISISLFLCFWGGEQCVNGYLSAADRKNMHLRCSTDGMI